MRSAVYAFQFRFETTIRKIKLTKRFKTHQQYEFSSTHLLFVFGVAVHALRGGRLVHSVLAVFHRRRTVFGRSVLCGGGGSILNGSILLLLLFGNSHNSGETHCDTEIGTGHAHHDEARCEERVVWRKRAREREKEKWKKRTKNQNGEVRVHFRYVQFFSIVCLHICIIAGRGMMS